MWFGCVIKSVYTSCASVTAANSELKLVGVDNGKGFAARPKFNLSRLAPRGWSNLRIVWWSIMSCYGQRAKIKTN